MRYKLMLSALAVAVMAYAAVASPIGSPGGFDPGAARKDLSNVDPATGRTALDAEQAGVAAAHVASTGTDVHGLGTMASEAKADYVATSTLTAHTGNTANPHSVTYEQVGAEQLGAVATHDALTAAHGVAEVAGIEDIPNNASFTLAGLGTKPFSALTDKPTTLSGYGITDAASTTALSDHASDTSTHGKTTLAGMEDIDDLSGVTDASTARSNLGVAASSSTVLTSGANAMTGSLKFSDNYGILQSTSDGADSGYTGMAGGGEFGTTRGAHVYLFGNEHASAGGQARYNAGNVSTGDHIFYTGAGTELLRLGYDASALFSEKTYFNAKPASIDTNVYIDNGFEVGFGGGTTYPMRFQLEQDSATTYFHSNLYYSGGSWKCFDTARAAAGIRMLCLANESCIDFYTSATSNAEPTHAMRLTKNRNLLLGTTTDDGTNKLQVNGSVAISTFAQLASPTAIPTAAAGRIYFNGTEQKFKKCLNGSTWVDM